MVFYDNAFVGGYDSTKLLVANLLFELRETF
jgi:hypothetical protein